MNKRSMTNEEIKVIERLPTFQQQSNKGHVEVARQPTFDQKFNDFGEKKATTNKNDSLHEECSNSISP